MYLQQKKQYAIFTSRDWRATYGIEKISSIINSAYTNGMNQITLSCGFPNGEFLGISSASWGGSSKGSSKIYVYLILCIMKLANSEQAETKKANNCNRRNNPGWFEPKKSAQKPIKNVRIKLEAHILTICVSKNDLGDK